MLTSSLLMKLKGTNGFFKPPAFFDDNGKEVEPRAKPRKKPPNPHMGRTVNPPKSILPKKPDHEALRPFFACLPADRVKATLENSTQWFKHEGCERLCAAQKSRFPAAGVECLNEPVAYDTLFSDTPAHDDGLNGHGGCEMVQIVSVCKVSFPRGFEGIHPKMGGSC